MVVITVLVIIFHPNLLRTGNVLLTKLALMLDLNLKCGNPVHDVMELALSETTSATKMEKVVQSLLYALRLIWH